MSLTINTNLASLNAQRNLSTSQSSLATSLQRLSSGMRINSAKDDAAGLAISDRMTTQINGLGQAQRNANDAISLSQTAEGAMQEMTNNLQAIRTLAVQAANASNSASDRAALDQEVQQRLAEVDRIASQTQFNGQKVLDGTFGSAQFQVGANVGDTIGINLTQGVKSSQIGQLATSSTAVTATALGGTLTLAVGSNAAQTVGASLQGTAVGQSAGSAYSKALAINSSGVAGLTASASNNQGFALSAVATGAAGAYSLTVNGVAVFAATSTVTAGISQQQITDAINAQSSTTGVTAALSGGNLNLTSVDGRDIAIGQTIAGASTGGLTAGAANGVFSAGAYGTAAATTINYGKVSLSATDNITVGGAGGTDLGLAANSIVIAKDTTTLATQNVLTVAAANSTIQRVDSALTSISSFRSTFGAIQNRFQSTINNLATTTENLSAARSRVLDTDFAAETANLTKNQILSQAGTAILAQANTLPQSVLKLLQ